MKLREILRDEWRDLTAGRFPLIAVIFAVPLAFSIIFGFIYAQNTVRHIPMVIYDQDQTSLSRTLIQMYVDSERYEVKYYVASQEAFEQRISSDEALVGLAIPADFSKNVKKGNGAESMLMVNSTNNMFGNAALSSAQEINRGFSVAVAQKLMEGLNQLPSAAMNAAYPVHLGVRILNNPTTGYKQFMLAGLMLNGLQIAIMLVVPPMLIGECIRRRFGKETSSAMLVLGKAVFPWLAAILSYLVSMIVVVYGFDVPMRGSWFDALVVGAAFTFFVVGAMLLFSACSPNEVMSLQAPMLYIMPGLLYSGLSWPLFDMNTLAGFLAFLLPITYAGDTMRDILLAGYAPALWENAAKMIAGGLIMGLLALGIFSFRRHWGRKGGAVDERLADH